MPGVELEFYGRDLLAAASDSFGRPPPFCADLLESSAIPVQRGLSAAQGLPALHDYVHVFRIQFHTAADALGQFGGGQSGAAPQEGLVYQLTALDVIQDRAPHEVHGLLSGVVILLLIRSAHDELG